MQHFSSLNTYEKGTEITLWYLLLGVGSGLRDSLRFADEIKCFGRIFTILMTIFLFLA